MRIALVSQEYPPETARGGVGTQTYAKAHGLAGLGHEVWVISHSADQRRHEYGDGPVRVIRISGFDSRMPMHTLEAWWLAYSSAVAAALWELHKRSPIDLVDFPDYGAEGFTWLLNRPASERVPAVVQLHGPLAMLAQTIGWPETDSEFYRTGTFMEGACLRLADAVYSSSACSAQWCARTYGIPREGVDIIHTGVDTNHFSPRDVAKHSKPTIVFVGRIAESKGVGALVDAAVTLSSGIPGLRLRLIGRGEPDVIDSLTARAAAAGRDDLLELVGFVGREELPDHLSRAHVFAAPSTYEGGPGFVYLEAMACGLPVVACSGSGATEVVVSGQNGILVPPGNLNALVSALERLLGDEVQRTAMGARARRYSVEHADTGKCLRRLESFYLSVAARQTRGAAADQRSAVTQ
jgi:glycosyltransferase involved in cell wall biosynthesis